MESAAAIQKQPYGVVYIIKNSVNGKCYVGQSHLGKNGPTMPDHVRFAIRTANVGRKHSEESKEQIRQKLIGRVFSIEHRKKNSDAQLGENNHKWITLPIDSIKLMHMSGMSCTKIAKKFGVSFGTMKKRLEAI